MSQYTSKRSKKGVAASLKGYSRCNLSSEEIKNVLALVSLTNNRGFGIDPQQLHCQIKYQRWWWWWSYISQYYLEAVKKKWKQIMVLNTHSLNPYTYTYAALIIIQVMQSTYWAILVKICFRQIWLVEIIFSGYGRCGNIWSNWTSFSGLYQALPYKYSAKRTWTYNANEWNHHLLSPNKNNTPSP